MDVELPNGTLLQGIPDGTSKAQIAEKLKGSGITVPADWMDPAKKSRTTKLYEGSGVKGLLEGADIAASAASSGVAALAGGLVKAGGYANEALGIADSDANAAAARLEESLTYTPRTDKGRAVMSDVARGLQAFEDWTDKQGAQATEAIAAAGTKAAEVAKSLGAPKAVVDFIDRHKDQVASAYGAATKTTLNAAPMALGGELTRALPRGARVAGDEGVKPAAPPPQSPAASPAAATPTSAPSGASAAPQAPAAATAPDLTVAPGVPRGTPNTSLEGAAAPTPAPETPNTPRGRAEAFVRDRLGMTWDALGARTQAKLERVAADAQALDRLNPEAVKRQAKLEALRVPIKTTAGRLSRDDAQLIKEEGVAGTNAGRAIRQIDEEANAGLRKNIEVLIDRLRGVGASRGSALRGERVGEVIAGRSEEAPGILTKRQRQAKAVTNAKYAEARKTDPDAKVDAGPMYDFIRGEPDVINPQTQHLGWLRGWLKKAGIESLDEAGEPKERRPISAIELDDLRQLAGKHAGPTSPSAHYAGQVLAVIDKMFDEGLPNSAGKWKEARDAHRAERAEFKNQGAIDRLVGTKGGRFGTDPKTALEDVWKVSIKNARIDEIRQLKRSLLAGQDAETRLQGKQALRTLRAATAQNLLDEIQKGVSTNERGEANITADSINRWIRGIGNDGTVEGGEEKLQVIFGRKATRELMDIREAAQIAKTMPTTRVSGSNTFQNILNWMEDTGLGTVAKTVGPAVGELGSTVAKRLRTGATVRAASEDATSAGERSGSKALSKEGEALYRKQQEAIKRQQLATPPTYGGSP